MRWQTIYEGKWIFIILAILGAVAFWIQPWLALLPAGMILFSISFFRDPERVISTNPQDIVSPADGVVTHVEEGAEIPEGEGTGWRVSIFLSVFNVHVNRAPVAGRIVTLKPRQGLFLDARDPDCHLKNECLTWGFIETHSHRHVTVRQITGAIARRIVGWSKVGDVVEKGHRFGMIRFGSRTDLFLPAEARILVKPGDRVQGGSSIVATWGAKS